LGLANRGQRNPTVVESLLGGITAAEEEARSRLIGRWFRELTPGQAAAFDKARAGQSEGTGARDQDEMQIEVMSPLQYDILDALRNLKAIDPEKRVTGPDIASKVGGGATEQSVKGPLADLKRRGLVDSKTGRHGGSWLTSKGLDCINGLRPKQ
jgi:hypothetical protein